MANMSYCRFQNTRIDFDDCVKELEDMLSDGKTLDDLSREEKGAAIRLRALAEEYMEYFDQLEEREDPDE
jgi:hypothetical protein